MRKYLNYPTRDLWDNFHRPEFLPWLGKVLLYNILNIRKPKFPLDSIINYRDWFWNFKLDNGKVRRIQFDED